jgi:divalent metal cation (Fe/Co/Zn/Cd) transporter
MPWEEAHEICTKTEDAVEEKFGYISTIHPETITWK